MNVERVDYITIATQDGDRARAWYRDVLGLAVDPNNPAELTAGQVTLTFWSPVEDGLAFQPNIGGFAVRVADVDAAKHELEAKGVEFDGDIRDTGVCHMAFFKDSEGNQLMLHHRYAPPS